MNNTLLSQDASLRIWAKFWSAHPNGILDFAFGSTDIHASIILYYKSAGWDLELAQHAHGGWTIPESQVDFFLLSL